MPRRLGDRLHSGRLDRFVTIQQRPVADTSDATSSEPVSTWTNLVTNVPMSRADLSGSEQFRADQMTARFDTEWEMQWRADMDPDAVDVAKVRRLKLGTRLYDIVRCVEVGKRKGLRIQTVASSQVPT